VLASRWLLCAALVAALTLGARHACLAATREHGPWRRALRRLAGNRVAVLAFGVILALATIALLAPWLVPYDPTAQADIVTLKNLPPTAAHLFGTDFASRDVFSRVLYGARVSLSIALLAILLSSSIGTAYGAIAGYYGGRVDGVMMRAIDVLLSIPRIVLLICIVALWGSLSVPSLVLIIALTGWFGACRIVRAQVLSLREQEMVVAARALGASGTRILWRHIIPNVLSPVIVAATLGIGNVILIETGLSYLGAGVQPPAASWGSIIADGRDVMATMWWIAFFPGLAIVLTVMAFNLVGDALRDALDPRQLDS
jgi:peptide/nickel transport system permease protein